MEYVEIVMAKIEKASEEKMSQNKPSTQGPIGCGTEGLTAISNGCFGEVANQERVFIFSLKNQTLFTSQITIKGYANSCCLCTRFSCPSKDSSFLKK
jgi:hypothetical protein